MMIEAIRYSMGFAPARISLPGTTRHRQLRDRKLTAQRGGDSELRKPRSKSNSTAVSTESEISALPITEKLIMLAGAEEVFNAQSTDDLRSAIRMIADTFERGQL